MSRDPARAASQFFGGRACLDFANTLDWRTSAEPQELVPDYASFLAWSRRRGTLPTRCIQALATRARRDHTTAAAVLAEAHALRGEIVLASDRLRAGLGAPLAALNAALQALPPQPSLVPELGRYVPDLPGDDLREPLWPIVWSVAALLTSADAARVGCCRADGCGWFFVDESPNHTRLWCSSEVCGNRERARRAYAKKKDRSG